MPEVSAMFQSPFPISNKRIAFSDFAAEWVNGFRAANDRKLPLRRVLSNILLNCFPGSCRTNPSSPGQLATPTGAQNSSRSARSGVGSTLDWRDSARSSRLFHCGVGARFTEPDFQRSVLYKHHISSARQKIVVHRRSRSVSGERNRHRL